jgi:acetyl esterase/lipase
LIDPVSVSQSGFSATGVWKVGLPSALRMLSNRLMQHDGFARLAATLAAVVSLLSAAYGQTSASWSLPTTIKIREGIPYDRYPETVLDILEPSTPVSEGLRPGAVVLHGGGYDHGNRHEDYQELFCRFLVERGFVVANPEFRLANVAPAPAAIQDGLKATRWFADHAAEYRVDPAKIIAIGASSGGHLALLVGMLPAESRIGPVTKLAAIIDMFGPADLSNDNPGPGQRMRASGWLPKQDGNGDLAKALSPINCVRTGLPPVLIIHGDRDQLVPYSQSVELKTRLKQAGNEVESFTMAGDGHVRPRAATQPWPTMQQWISDFLKRYGIVK